MAKKGQNLRLLGKTLVFPVIDDERGSLAYIETQRHVPFEIRRVYYLYDVPSGAERGGHAHRELQQVLIALAGSFDVVLDDASERRRFRLNRPDRGLLIGSMIWREIENFSAGAVCLVLASREYEEADYYRDYQQFRRAVGESIA